MDLINHFQDSVSKQIGDHYMINNGLKELAANAVEIVVDARSAIAYCVYLSSENVYGESSELVNLAKFNILQPTNVEWITVFDNAKDFGGSRLSECNLIDLDSDTIRVFALDMGSYCYFYKDIHKKTLKVGALEKVMYQPFENAPCVAFSRTDINAHINDLGGQAFSHLQFTSSILKVDGWFYTSICGGNAIDNFLFARSRDGQTWTFLSMVKHLVNYEAMLAYHDRKFWVMCRSGATAPTEDTQRNLMYSDDGISWKESNLQLTTSDTRPYLFCYQDSLYLAYSSPLPEDFSTVRPWRCNIHVGKILSKDGKERFQELIYKESKFGIVYYALLDWYGKMIMLYSSGELHPKEGLIHGWTSGKDCLNYTVLHTQEPLLRFD